jgi:dTMP kinase
MSSRGRFVVLEGTDGSGTTTQCQLLVTTLVGIGIPAMATREPTRGPVGELLRAVLEKRLIRASGRQASLDWSTFALLFAADRSDHVQEEIAPALASGVWVICDRYDLSSLIYQSLTAPDPDAALPWVRDLNLQALRPDLVLVLDVDAEVAEQRRRARGGTEELFEQRELQEKLAEAYLVAERFAPHDALEHIDGAASAVEVAAHVLKAVRSRLAAESGDFDSATHRA